MASLQVGLIFLIGTGCGTEPGGGSYGGMGGRRNPGGGDGEWIAVAPAGGHGDDDITHLLGGSGGGGGHERQGGSSVSDQIVAGDTRYWGRSLGGGGRGCPLERSSQKRRIRIRRGNLPEGKPDHPRRSFYSG